MSGQENAKSSGQGEYKEGESEGPEGWAPSLMFEKTGS